MAVGVAFRAFFAALFQSDASERIRVALDSTNLPAPTAPPPPSAKDVSEAPGRKPVAAPTRSEALTLLSTLQREARLLDLVQEPLESFEDAQIGAAAREVLKDCRQTLDRMFGIIPLAEEEEGSTRGLEPGVSPNRVRLVGRSDGSSGTITHRGWQATRCDVPLWSGGRNEGWILAPTEIEVN